jgi:catechol 2,3-dioxygenase-like lactoylglutathione lyase family enzyme
MKYLLSLLVVAAFSVPLAAQNKVTRPKITGIDHVRIYVTDVDKSRQFYEKLVGVRLKGGMCFENPGRCFTVGWGEDQTIELEQLPANANNLLAETALATDDIKRMHDYLATQGVVAGRIIKGKYAKYFELHDPEGSPISFVQRTAIPIDDPGPGDPLVRMIHAGFVVHNRPAEEHFYEGILGFRPYWHGGMKDDQTDWVSLQVPNGTDWVEFMVNVSPTADHHTLGVMNHIAIGVKDIQATKEQLIKNGWTPKEEPKLGRDGKWQLNLYDPDDTRVEFMEFKPKEKPCCSEFTGTHPGPQ